VTPSQAKAKKVGDRVRWTPTGELGVVTETGEAGLRVTWADGTVGTYLYAASGTPFFRIESVKK
jgi:hypothetical protein